MSRIAAILVVLLAVAAGTAGGTARAEGAPKPALRLLGLQPIVLAGRSFEARERVKVVLVQGDQTVVRTVRAGTEGGFLLRFPELTVKRCEGVLARATGGRGSRAILKLAQPACSIGRDPG